MVQVSVSHPSRASAARSPMLGGWVPTRIRVENDDQIAHLNAKIYFNPAGPPTEMWWVRYWTPDVPVADVPGKGLLFHIGTLMPGASFTIAVKMIAPVIVKTKTYPIEVGFESDDKPREILYKGKITIEAHRR